MHNKKEEWKFIKNPILLLYWDTLQFFLVKYKKNSSLLSIKDLLNKNYKVVLIYPYVTYKDNISDELKKEYFDNRNFFGENPNLILSSEFKIYSKNHSQTFDALDSIQDKNLFRVYQHKLFCDNYMKDKCVFN